METKKMKCCVKWVRTENVVGGTYQISSNNPFLIIAAQAPDGSIELNANNIIITPAGERYMDLLSAESDYFTRALFFTTADLDQSNMRTGTCAVGLFQSVQIVEYSVEP